MTTTVARKSKKEIIDETAAAYTLNTRAFGGKDGDGCHYIMEDGRMCAVGRCLVDPLPWSGVVSSQWYEIGTRFKPEYAGHERGFWSDVQFLHDSRDCWTESGLSELGQLYVRELHKTWDDK